MDLPSRAPMPNTLAKLRGRHAQVMGLPSRAPMPSTMMSPHGKYFHLQLYKRGTRGDGELHPSSTVVF
jgi:hypothetical protein